MREFETVVEDSVYCKSITFYDSRVYYIHVMTNINFVPRFLLVRHTTIVIGDLIIHIPFYLLSFIIGSSSSC